MDHHGLESTKKFVSDVFPSRRPALSKDAPTCIRSGKQTLEGHVKCWKRLLPNLPLSHAVSFILLSHACRPDDAGCKLKSGLECLETPACQRADAASLLVHCTTLVEHG